MTFRFHIGKATEAACEFLERAGGRIMREKRPEHDRRRRGAEEEGAALRTAA